MQDDESTDWIKYNPNYKPASGIDSTYWHTFYFDTNKMPDGVRFFRWYAFLTHTNGNTEVGRAGWPLNVQNGKTDKGSINPVRFQGSGWYKEASNGTDWGYQTAFVNSGIPTAPVKGIWRPSVTFSCNGCSNFAGYLATIDPDFHNGSAGKIVLQGSGKWSGQLNIDTTKLTNGKHRLFLSSTSKRSNPAAQHSGVLAFYFNVQN
jgi:hypothetical protein